VTFALREVSHSAISLIGFTPGGYRGVSKVPCDYPLTGPRALLAHRISAALTAGAGLLALALAIVIVVRRRLEQALATPLPASRMP
jgi:hypothetical protein